MKQVPLIGTSPMIGTYDFASENQAKKPAQKLPTKAKKAEYFRIIPVKPKPYEMPI